MAWLTNDNVGFSLASRILKSGERRDGNLELDYDFGKWPSSGSTLARSTNGR